MNGNQRMQKSQMVGGLAAALGRLLILTAVALASSTHGSNKADAAEGKKAGDDVGVEKQNYADELPRIEPTDASETLKAFTIADGFKIQLVASEPLVASPVAIEWDADGAMYVCEMRGYSENREDGLSRIRRLTDSDHDGKYDQAVVFVDELLWPTAIFPYDGGLFIGDAPDLLYCKDTDGDGVADVKKVVLTGFGTSNVQGLMNSFRWGLDNRIHIACSSVGGKVHRPGDEENAVNVRGRDLSFDPRTFDLRLTSGGGQHGMCFDDWGHKFASSNSNHIQQIMYEDRYIARNRWFSTSSARVSIAADGPQAEVFRTSPVEPWRIVRTRLRVGGVVPGPIEGGGRAAGYFTGATGVTIYRGNAWPASWNGLAIIGDVGSNLIHRKRLDTDRLQMVAHRIDPQTEFVSSSDIWFRPAQFANAPDGSLHVIDVCREVIEHPKSLPPQIKQHLDLNSGRDRGRIYRIIASDDSSQPARDNAIPQSGSLSDLETTDLVKLLEHPNAWQRETAARLLFERQDRQAIEPARLLSRNSKLPQGRMHALYALQGLDALDADTLRESLEDKHPQVRRHAIRLCENLASTQPIHAKLTAMTEDPDREVRYQLAFTLGSIQHPKRIELLTRLIKAEADSRWLATAVQSSLSSGAGEMFAELAGDPDFRSDTASQFLSSLAAQLRVQNDPEENMRARFALTTLSKQDPLFALPIAGKLLEPLSEGQKRVNGDPQSKDSINQVIDALIQSATDIASDTEMGTATRVRAVRALSLGAWEKVGDLLIELIDNRQPVEIQKASIETIGKFSSNQVATPLLDRWNGLSPSLRQTASEVLFARPERILQFFDAVDRGDLLIQDLPQDRVTISANSSNRTVKTRALGYLQGMAAPSGKNMISQYQQALKGEGDIKAGRAHFLKHCAACHRAEGQGHEIGPNLATIKNRGADSILANVLDPNAEVNPQYLNYVLLTVDGRTVTGMIASENANSITLRRAEMASDTILRSDIEAMHSTGKSIMPEGMEKSLDVPAMADLIAYLMQVK